MIRITVTGRQGAPVARTPGTVFGPQGGSIGRGDANTLVLSDPERTVSRVHAQVLCRGGRFFVVDRGSNAMLCNGKPLGAGNEAPLGGGDRLVIGGFELMVEDAGGAAESGLGLLDVGGATPQAAFSAPPGGHPGAAGPGVPTPATDDPFADLLAGIGGAPAAAAPSARAASPAASSASHAAGSPSFGHGMPPASSAPAASAAALPFDDLLGPSAAPASAADPFADLLAPPPAAPHGRPAPGALDDFSDLGLPAPSANSASIDALFGTGSGLGGDPLALSPLADPLRQPNTAADRDPFAALQSTPPAPAAAPRSDHLPIGQFGFTPPKAVSPAPPRAASLPATPAASAPPAPPAASAPPAPPAASAPPAPNVPPPDELLAALLRGLGSLQQSPAVLTPGLMERIGQLLRHSTEGTLQLLLTRQEFKREVRAEVTMIASQANNPLKFSPTVEVALAHLLGPGVRGFMPAEAAMKDAFDDLRAHQFGVMVGLRAALAHVIERFAPDELEKKIAAKSALDSLFAANRKAKLWDQFIALYGGIASEAEDDFHALFGKAFLEAYEAQMAQLKARG